MENPNEIGERSGKPRFDDDEFEGEGRKPFGRTGRDRQSIREQERENDPNWNDPDVLARYGLRPKEEAHWGFVPPKLLTLLLQFTVEGSDELGAIIDVDTGAILEIQRGTPNTVQLNADLLSSELDIIPIHTHDENMPFSAKDWSGFVYSPAVATEILITPDYAYIYTKEKRFYKGLSKRREEPGALFERLKKRAEEEGLDDSEAFKSASSEVADYFEVLVEKKDLPYNVNQKEDRDAKESL